MKRLIGWAAPLLIAGLAAPTALAQDEEETPVSYSYATYHYCDTAKQERMDEIVAEIHAPIYNKAVEDGEITGWGWLAHATGGKWRRVQVHAAPSLDALLDALESINGKIREADEEAWVEAGQICNSHDDYIWQTQAGTGLTNRGKVGFSVYYVCDEALEDQADEIVKNEIGAILDRYVAEDKFATWGWLSHWVGGKYRRLQTMTAADHKSLLAARNELIEDLYGEEGAPGRKFTEICGSHADYMWDIQIWNP